MRHRNSGKLISVLTILTLHFSSVSAQDGYYDGGVWEFIFGLYGWGISMNGQTGIGDNIIDVDLSFDDLSKFNNRSFAGRFEAAKGRWAYFLDIQFGSLQAADLTSTQDVNINTFEAGIAYIIAGRLEGILGARYQTFNSDFASTGAPPESISQNWFDPYVGGRLIIPLGSLFFATVRGDVGGFGVGSDFSYNGIGSLGIQSVSYTHLTLPTKRIV